MKNTVTIEYGELYNPKLEELIDLKKFDFINIQDVRIESNIINEENKEYPAVGTYEINVYYKYIVLIQKVECKDTTKPELSIKDGIEIEYNTDLATLDLKNYITVSDLSELKDYTIDFSKVNTSISGEYETDIAVEDCYGNKTEDNFKIKVGR